MKKSIFCTLLHLSIIGTILNAMEYSPLSPEEIERLAKLMKPISKGKYLAQEEHQEFSELVTKIRDQVEKRKEELTQQITQKNDQSYEQQK